MPSFLERMRRLLNGEPIFRPGEDVDNSQQAQEKDDWDMPPQAHTPEPGAQQPSPVPVTAGPKVIPLVTIERVECHMSGPNMEVTAHIKNHAAGTVLIDKIILMGQSRELDRELQPGEQYEFVNVYNGPRPNHHNYTHCELHYRDEHGDYFSAIHNAEFQQESDGTYIISRLRFLPPVKDI